MSHTTLAIAILLLALSCANAISHTCLHDTYVLGHNHEQLYTLAKQKYSTSGIISDAATTQKIRILLDTSALEVDPGFSCAHKGEIIDIDNKQYACTSDDILTNDKKSFLEDVLLPAANDRLSSIFRVAPKELY